MPIQKETACKAIARDNIAYITAAWKTTDGEGNRWVCVQNMTALPDDSPERMQEDFDRINSRFKKNWKYRERKYYHAVINFKSIPGVTPEMAMKVGEAYIKEFFPDHQAVMAVHMDKDGIDFHACVNSVDLSGKKEHRSSVKLMNRKDFVNQIAYEMYGIKPFDWKKAVKEKRKRDKEELPIGKANRYNAAEKRMHAEGRASELDELRVKILTAALASCTRKEFEEWLKAVGVTMPRNTAKTVSFKYNDTKKGTVRGSTLGDHYRAEYIDELLAYNREQAYSVRPKERQTVFSREDMKQICDHKDDLLAKSRNVFRFLEDKNEYRYKRSEPFGIWVSRAEFYRASPNTLVLLYAVACVLLSKSQYTVLRVREGQEIVEDVVFRNGSFYFGDVRAKTDPRLQRMADALSTATTMRLKHGCENRGDLDRLHSELLSKQEELATDLRKERRIETSMKKKLKQKQSVLHAAEKVASCEGTFEEVNHAKHILYRNGFCEDDFYIYTTAIKCKHAVMDAEDTLEEQSQIVKNLFFQNKQIKKELSDLSKALDTFDRINEPGFYYGSEHSEAHYVEQDCEEKAFREAASLSDLLAQAEQRAGAPQACEERDRMRTSLKKEEG